MRWYANTRDEVIYPVRVGILATERNATETATLQQTQNYNQYLTWRESIRKSFHNQHLSTLCWIEVRPISIVDQAAWINRDLFVSELELRCHSIEARG